MKINWIRRRRSNDGFVENLCNQIDLTSITLLFTSFFFSSNLCCPLGSILSEPLFIITLINAHTLYDIIDFILKLPKATLDDYKKKGKERNEQAQ